MPDQPATTSVGPRLALVGGLLVVVTAAGWVWFVLRPFDPGLDTGTVPFAAVTIAWISGAATWPRAVVRALGSLLVWVAAWVGVIVALEGGFELADGAWRLLWWQWVLPPLAVALGWLARRDGPSPARAVPAALLVALAVADGTYELIDGHAVRALLAVLAALWLARVLSIPRPARPGERSRWAMTVVRAVIVVLGVAYVAVLVEDASLPDSRAVREYSYGPADEDGGLAALERFLEREDSGWLELTP